MRTAFQTDDELARAMSKTLERAKERGADPPIFKRTTDRPLAEFRLECLKLVWPASSPNADPQHYIAKAETLLNWVLSGGDNGTATPATPADPASSSPDNPASKRSFAPTMAPAKRGVAHSERDR